MGKNTFGWGYWGILFFAITGHAEPPEKISTGLWGVPFSVPATYRAVEVRHGEDNGVSDTVTERVDNWEKQGRIYFRADYPVGVEPTFYEGEFVFDLNNSMDLGALRTPALRAFFQQVPYYTGSPVSIEVEPGLWAPAQFQDLVVAVSKMGGSKIYARFTHTNLQRNYDAVDVYEYGTNAWEIPWTEVESRVLPRAAGLDRLPKQPADQNLFLAPVDEPAVPVVVLGFVTIPAARRRPAEEIAYVVERRRLELRNSVSNLPIYKVPAGLLRTAPAAKAEALRRESRVPTYEPPRWLRALDTRIGFSGSRPLNFNEAVRALNGALGVHLIRDEMLLLPVLGTCDVSVLNAA